MTNTQRRFLPSFILSLVPDSVVKEMVHFSQTVAKVRGNFDLWKSLKNGASQKLRMCCSLFLLCLPCSHGKYRPGSKWRRLGADRTQDLIRQHTESAPHPLPEGNCFTLLHLFLHPLTRERFFVGIHLQWKRVSTRFCFPLPIPREQCFN